MRHPPKQTVNVFGWVFEQTRDLQRAGFGCTVVMGFVRVANAVLTLVEPSWLTDFNIVAVAAYTAAELAFILSVEAIVQPAVRMNYLEVCFGDRAT